MSAIHRINQLALRITPRYATLGMRKFSTGSRRGMLSTTVSQVSETPKVDIPPISMQTRQGFHVDSEYGHLQKVLIGKADGFRLPTFEHEPLLDERNEAGVYNHVGEPYPANVIEEANKSLLELQEKLKAWNPNIEIVLSNMEAKNNHNERVGNRGYSTRDVMVAVKDTLYLCPSVHQSRATEVEDCFPHIVDMYKATGNDKVVDLRTPDWWRLVNSPDNNLRAKDPETEKVFLQNLREEAAALDKEHMVEHPNIKTAKINGDSQDGRFASLGDADYFSRELPVENNLAITEEVPIFDAANILVGDSKHLIYLVSISGNYHGYVHLKSVMSKVGVTVLPVANVYNGTHIDSTMAILNKEKILICVERMSVDVAYNIMKHCGYTDKSNYIPVHKEDMYDVGLWNKDQDFASVYIGMNLLAVSEDTLIVEEKQERLIAKLKDHGFKIITVSYPHMRSMGGGVHCTTLPLMRS